MINYYLTKSTLSKDLENTSPVYIPHTISSESVEFEQIIKEVSRGTTVMPADAKAVLENFMEIIANNLAQGRSVKTNITLFKPVIKGTFESPQEAFSRDKHSISVSIQPTAGFMKLIEQNAKVSKIDTREKRPKIDSIVNSDGLILTTIMPGKLVKLRGSVLKFNKNNPEEGVFLTGSQGSIRVEEYGDITPKSITLIFPTLTQGEEYKVSVKSLFGTEIRTGELKEVITLS